MKLIFSTAKKYWLIFFGIVLFLALCAYNIQEQYLFNGDSARDTLESLRILRNKDLTIIGPPLSLGLNSTREVYFSSIIYYVGAFMLFISNNSIISTVLIISVINASAVIPLYLILKKNKLTMKEIALLLLLYITNPEVISYSRILWNPSPLIGLGFWGLYYLNRSALIFGIVIGLSMYFHYFAIVFIVFGATYYLLKKQYKNVLHSIISFTLTLTPFIVFEIKNKFYLISAFIYNLQHMQSEGDITQKFDIFLKIPVQLLGLINNPFTTKIIHISDISVVIGLVIWILLIILNRKNIYLLLFILTSILTVFSSKEHVGTQYMFISIGALISYCINVKSSVSKYIIVALVIIQSINTIYIIQYGFRANAEYRFPSVRELEMVSDEIQSLHNEGSVFNITENVEGDARATYLRFYLERDRVPGLQDELTYENLDELYVLTPSLEKTLKENRWEFSATSNLVKTEEKLVGDFKLLKYERQN